MAANFVNVDLEVVSPESLDHFCCEMLELGVRKLYCGDARGGFLATFECNELGACDPNSLIDSFTQMIASVDERAKAQWDAAHSKTFDIGYEADASAGSYRSELKPEVVQSVADLGASIIVTIYPRPWEWPEDKKQMTESK